MTDEQKALRAKILELEKELSRVLDDLVASKVRLRVLQELEQEPPVPRRTTAVTTMTKREKVARVLRSAAPKGLRLDEIVEELNRTYAEHINKPTLSAMLNRLKTEDYVIKGKGNHWYWFQGRKTDQNHS